MAKWIPCPQCGTEFFEEPEAFGFRRKTNRQQVQEALDLLRTVSKDDVTLLKARNYLIEWKVNH